MVENQGSMRNTPFSNTWMGRLCKVDTVFGFGDGRFPEKQPQEVPKTSNIFVFPRLTRITFKNRMPPHPLTDNKTLSYCESQCT